MRNKTCVPKLGVAMGVGGALTSWIGAQLAHVSPGWCVMLAAAAAIGYSATTMFRKALAVPKSGRKAAWQERAREAEKGVSRKAEDQAGKIAVGKTAEYLTGQVERRLENGVTQLDSEDMGEVAEAGGVALEPPTELPTIELGPKRIALAVFIGAVAGLASGYIGLGGGFLMIPLMISLLNMPMKLTSGTSLIAIMILALPATVVQCLNGNVDLLVGIAVACGSIPGAAVGAKLMKRVPERTLRFAFSYLLLFGAVMLVVKEMGFFG